MEYATNDILYFDAACWVVWGRIGNVVALSEIPHNTVHAASTETIQLHVKTLDSKNPSKLRKPTRIDAWAVVYRDLKTGKLFFGAANYDGMPVGQNKQRLLEKENNKRGAVPIDIVSLGYEEEPTHGRFVKVNYETT